ncbi:MAG: ATP-dependent DNA helicase RecG [Acidobacteria bacterium]|nr:ATP-dependent DNA helicase RecG [Acidobacteriota bacterium]MBI3664456.1 ATP-dependent DNA helicase RecG [Acidobacteriota bacterium]
MAPGLSDEVKYLKGVGPQRAVMLAQRGIQCVEDLLYYLPFRYEDRTQFSKIREIQPGGTHTILAEVVSGGLVRFARGRNAIYHLAVRDAGPVQPGLLHCRFFHGGYLEGKLKTGQRMVLHGKADIDPYRPTRIEMINPQMELLSGDGATDSTEVGRIVPIYEAIGGMSSRTLRRVIYGALQGLDATLPDPLPKSMLERLWNTPAFSGRLPSKRDAIAQTHFPPPQEDLETLNAFRSRAQQRLILEEFFYYQLGLALQRQKTRRETGIAFRVREDRIREAVKRVLPFKPTGAQKRVLGEIAADMERPAPMHRLLQGDVGSGKTIVALEAATIAIENGYQTALMAPTEILAVQHYLSARRVYARAGYRVELLISGLPAREKKAARERVAKGTAQFIVGTHAVIEEAVKFARLGLVIVDEQHRFGVMQRKQLIEKGVGREKGQPHPDVLVMTATPIPRTLSLTMYGDLDVSVIDELPPGRTPIETRVTTEHHLPGVWEFVRSEVARGRQAYVIYPVIEESKQELKAATAEYERLSKQAWPRLRVGLLHGRMRSEEKEDVMERFRKGEIQILVSTTVIEVGVDVPNATVMVVEHAERFGLAQLHQLRGRIGRGSEKSHCILVSPKKPTEEAKRRLDTMAETTDGFKIAEMDLQLRGPGEFFGTRQHGELGFQVASPLRDKELLELARREAFALVENPREESEVKRLVAYLGPKWQRRYQLARVG